LNVPKSNSPANKRENSRSELDASRGTARSSKTQRGEGGEANWRFKRLCDCGGVEAANWRFKRLCEGEEKESNGQAEATSSPSTSMIVPWQRFRYSLFYLLPLNSVSNNNMQRSTQEKFVSAVFALELFLFLIPHHRIWI
jgi:hypothetical protein